MKAYFLFFLFVVTATVLLFDTTAVEATQCLRTNECYKPCTEETGCPNAKCINRRCKCYGCSG